MAHPNAEILRQADEAMERGDTEGFLSHYADDVVVHAAGSNRRRSSRVSVVATTRSTSSGGNALVNAPTDTRSGSQPSGDTPSDPSCATPRSSRRTITRPGTRAGVSPLRST